MIDKKALTLTSLAPRILIVVLSFGATGLFNSVRAESLAATPSSASFPNVPQGESYSQAIRLSNSATSGLRITKITSSNSYFAVSGVTLPLSIAKGSSANITISYKPQSLGTTSATVSVYTNVDSSPLQIKLSGSVVRDTIGVSSSSSSVAFSNVGIGTKVTKTITLTSDGNSNLAISKLSVSGAGYTVTGSALTLSPNQKTTVEVSFDPTSTGGKTGTLSIYSNAPNSPLKIALSGNGVAASTHSVSLKWSGKGSVSGYYVYRATSSAGPYTQLNATAIVAEEYTDLTVASGETYYYVVRATNAGDESDDSNEVSVKVP